MRRRRVARDDDRLHPLVLEPGRDLARVAPHRIRAFGAVGDAGRIAEVDDALVRQLAHELPHDGETADARIEDADWRARIARGLHHRTVAVSRVLSPSRVRETRAGTSQSWAATKASAAAKR